MKGDVLNYDDNQGTGQISGADGIRYSFTRADLKQLIPIGRGTKVDFDFDGKIAKDIYIDNPAGAAAHAHTHAHPPIPSGSPEPRLSLWGYYARAYTTRYVKFSGRARRKEYWAVVLFSTIVMLVAFGFIFAGLVGRSLGRSSIETIAWMAVNSPISMTGLFIAGGYTLISVLPVTTLLFRRLHDIGRPGWIALILVAAYVIGVFTPASIFALFSSVSILILSVIPGKAGENDYGPSPK